MADIYSLHLQWNLGSTFSGTQIRDVHFSLGGHRWSWCQPVWGETFILRWEKCTVSHPLGLGPRRDLPAELLLPMTRANDPVLQRTRHYSEDRLASYRHWVWGSRAEVDGHSQVRDICHCEVRGEAGLHSWKLLLTSLLIVSSGLFVQLQINPVVGNIKEICTLTSETGQQAATAQGTAITKATQLKSTFFIRLCHNLAVSSDIKQVF